MGAFGGNASAWNARGVPAGWLSPAVTFGKFAEGRETSNKASEVSKDYAREVFRNQLAKLAS